jgi:hypothetical protein
VRAASSWWRMVCFGWEDEVGIAGCSVFEVGILVIMGSDV